MKQVKVYGTGCKSCATTAEIIEQVARELALDVEVEKVTDLEQIMQAGIINTPGVTINGEVKHSGSVPSVGLVQEMLI